MREITEKAWRAEAIHRAPRRPGACPCGHCDWAVSESMIWCQICGRTWGRVNGAWVLDEETIPKEESDGA